MTIAQQKTSKSLDEKNSVYVHFKPSFDSIPALGSAMVKLDRINKGIAANAALQLQNTTGTTKSKGGTKTGLGKLTCRIAGGLSSLATNNNDMVLFDKCQLTVAAFEVINDKLVEPTCKNIYDLAMANLDAIADQGISADLVSQLKTDTDAYVLLSKQPRDKINDRSGYTQKLVDLFEEARLLEKQVIKKLLLSLEAVNLEAYNTYINVSKPSHSDDDATAKQPSPTA